MECGGGQCGHTTATAELNRDTALVGVIKMQENVTLVVENLRILTFGV